MPRRVLYADNFRNRLSLGQLIGIDVAQTEMTNQSLTPALRKHRARFWPASTDFGDDHQSFRIGMKRGRRDYRSDYSGFAPDGKGTAHHDKGGAESRRFGRRSSDIDGAKIVQEMGIKSNKAVVGMLKTAREQLTTDP
jgi:hypothetical protein